MNALTRALLNAGTNKSAANTTKANVPKRDEPMVRILTVDIKIMRTHMRDDHFNNIHTILEVHGELSGRLKHRFRADEWKIYGTKC